MAPAARFDSMDKKTACYRFLSGPVFLGIGTAWARRHFATMNAMEGNIKRGSAWAKRSRADQRERILRRLRSSE